MSKISIEYKNNILIIKDIESNEQEKIDVTLLEHGLDYESKIKPNKFVLRRIYFFIRYITGKIQTVSMAK